MKRENRYKFLTFLSMITAALVLFSIQHFGVLTILRNLLTLAYLPQLGSGAGYGLLWLFGFLASFHCLGKCGGIALSQSIRPAAEPAGTAAPSGRSYERLAPALLYHSGRVLSYTLVGGIAGALGRLVRFSGVLGGVIPILGGLFMIIMAVNLLGAFPLFRKLTIRMPLFAAKKLMGKKKYSPFYVGILSSLMPCGPLQIVQLYALGTGSFFHGALALFIFCLGTVPVLFLFGLVNTVISKKQADVILKAGAVLVLILGLSMLGRGLALSGVALADAFFSPSPVAAAANSTRSTALASENKQVVRTKIGADFYPPITVQKGIPVHWIIVVDKNDLNDCNKTLIIPRLKLEKKLTAGENEIDFTPAETGDIVYSCWMGMIKSKIIVVD
jgi:sulfite exporter TauE/SafE